MVPRCRAIPASDGNIENLLLSNTRRSFLVRHLRWYSRVPDHTGDVRSSQPFFEKPTHHPGTFRFPFNLMWQAWFLFKDRQPFIAFVYCVTKARTDTLLSFISCELFSCARYAYDAWHPMLFRAPPQISNDSWNEVFEISLGRTRLRFETDFFVSYTPVPQPGVSWRREGPDFLPFGRAPKSIFKTHQILMFKYAES